MQNTLLVVQYTGRSAADEAAEQEAPSMYVKCKEVPWGVG